MSKKKSLTGKEVQDEKVTSPFVIAQTYGDALELNEVLTDLKSDPIVNNFYKLKLAGIDAIIKLKPIVAQVKELEKPSDDYVNYIKERNDLYGRYAEKEGGKEDGAPVLYKDATCTEKVQHNDSVRYYFYNFGDKQDVVNEQHKVLQERYKNAIASEEDRENTRIELLKSELPNDFHLQQVGGDYPTNLPMRYLYQFLTFGIVTAKE
jgi:hypothetical protein